MIEPTEEECMSIGFMLGGGMTDEEIVVNLVGAGHSEKSARETLEYVMSLSAEYEQERTRANLEETS